MGNFTVFLPKFRAPDYWLARSEDIVPHAHNEFLEVLSETGAAGFIAFMAILFFWARSVAKGLKNSDGSERILLAAFAGGIVAILVDNLASMNLRTVPVAVAFWMIAGLSLGNEGGNTFSFRLPLASAPRFLRFTPYLACGLLAVWYLPRVWNSYTAQRFALEGDLLRFQNKASESSGKYAEALRYDPGLAEIRLYLAAQQAHEARYQEARKNIDTILTRYPFYPKARFVRAISAFYLGDTAVALQSINDEMKIENSPQTLYYVAVTAIEAATSL
jgi:tetratricopeptide (TPR) repeat protein